MTRKKKNSFCRFKHTLIRGCVLILILLSAHARSQVVLSLWDFEDSNNIADLYNSENTGTIIEREGISALTYDAGNPGLCVTSSGWDGGSFTRYYMIRINTSYTGGIKMKFDHLSVNNGPRDFRVEYTIGTTGTWTAVTGSAYTLSPGTWLSSSVVLPAACDNQTAVYIRWIMTSDISTSGGTVSAAGSSSLDNINVSGIQNYSCFTYGYFRYHTCGSVYSFPSAAGGGLGATPPGVPGAPDYGLCWKNINAGNRANWIVIQPTTSGLWTFLFSPNTGNVNAWMWGPYDVLPNSCEDLQDLRDCNNGTGGNPITVSTMVEAGKFYVTLVTNPTGTNSIITLTTLSGDATLFPPTVYNAQQCGPGSLTLMASGAGADEQYQWWDAPSGGNLLKTASPDDSIFVTPVLSATTVYYVSKLFIMTAPYSDSCGSTRIPVTATINPIAVAPVSISTNLTNVCFPDTRDVILTANGGSGTTLRWYKDACYSIPVGSGNPLTVPAPVSTTSYFAAWETVCGISACASVTVTVNAPVTTGSIAATQTICEGEDPAPITSILDGTGSGVISYRWESFTGTGPWTTIPGAAGAAYDPPAGLLQNTSFRRITISTEAGGTCESQPATPVTVFINFVTPGRVGNNETICEGDTPAPFFEIIPATATGVQGYQWESASNASGPWVAIPGENGPVYTPPAGLSVTTFYRRIATSTLNSKVCPAVSPVISVTVNLLPSTSVIFHP